MGEGHTSAEGCYRGVVHAVATAQGMRRDVTRGVRRYMHAVMPCHVMSCDLAVAATHEALLDGGHGRALARRGAG